MKKLVFGSFILLAAITTGCVGETQSQLIGTWEYWPVHAESSVHKYQWKFQDDGQIIVTDLTVPAVDTGTYEVYATISHRFVKISGTQILDPNYSVNGEWYIITLDDASLVVFTKSFDTGIIGGALQRDLIRL